MNFRNASFDGMRGCANDTYREYIPGEDVEVLQELGRRMHDAITAVSGTTYDAGQSFSLYPTSGVSDDYAYSRHFVDSTKGKILSFTVECGRSFQPSWQEAEEVIREVCAGLIAFCIAARQHAVRMAGPSA